MVLKVQLVNQSSTMEGEELSSLQGEVLQQLKVNFLRFLAQVWVSTVVQRDNYTSE
jgi:hypothetical protein